MPEFEGNLLRARRGLAGAIAVLLIAGVVVLAQPGGDDKRDRPATAIDASDAGDAELGLPLAEDVAADNPDGTGPAAASTAAEFGAAQPASNASGVSGSVGETPAANASRIPTGPNTRGITDTTIQIGFITVSTAAFNAAAAAASGNPNNLADPNYNPDQHIAEQVNYINSTGGIAGRKVEPIVHRVDISNYITASGRQQEAQKACAAWTEDHQVFAMPNMADPLLIECAAKTKTVIVTPAIVSVASISQRKFDTMSDYWYSPVTFVADRENRAMAQFFLKRGLRDPGAKVALMIEDKPMTRDAAERGMKPALAAAGIKPFEILYPDAIESSWQNYVLQLQTEGITHVLFAANVGTAFAPGFMMRAAENQRYRPKWMMGSANNPDGLITLMQAPSEQLSNVLGMGWAPLVDIGDTTPQTAAGSRGHNCTEAMKKVGQPANCSELLLMFQAAFERASVASAAGLAEGISKLGDSHGSNATIGGATWFEPRRHDGPRVVRAVVYDPAAPEHMKYSGPTEVVAD